MRSCDSSPLCLECGLCCNGVIFARGQLRPGDDAARLESLGLILAGKQHSGRKNRKFVQPCAAFDGCRCGIYSDRPEYCRKFECLLLGKVNSGRLDSEAARRIIRKARRRADNVKQLLRQLGDRDEDVALSLRFRRMKRLLESHRPDRETADLFGRLTVAVHDLNRLLNDAFYRGPGS